MGHKRLSALISKTKFNQRSFTLIELLVVIAIIGLLASVVLVSVSSSLASARDAKRVQDINAIRVALELYYNKYGDYPPTNPNENSEINYCWNTWDGGTVLAPAGDTFIEELETEGFFEETPIERHPIASFDCSYKYVRKEGWLGNDGLPGHENECTQRFVVLYTALETNSNPAGKGDERPKCVLNWIDNHGAIVWEGALANDYAIWIPRE